MYDTITANCVQNCTATLPYWPHDQDENSNTLARYALLYHCKKLDMKPLYQIPIPIFAISVVPSPSYTLFWSHKMPISVHIVHQINLLVPVIRLPTFLPADMGSSSAIPQSPIKGIIYAL